MRAVLDVVCLPFRSGFEGLRRSAAKVLYGKPGLTPSQANQEWLLVAVIASTLGGVVLGFVVAFCR
jgi:hypothetical protein